MAKITDLSSMSDIAWQAAKIQQQMQKLYSLTLPPPAIQQMMKSMEKISQIVDPPVIRAMQDSMNVITKLNPVCNLPWPNAFNAISQIPLDVRTNLAESVLQQLDTVEISHTDVPEVTEEQEKQIDELFPTLKEKSLSRDKIIRLIILIINVIFTLATYEMESISHEDAIQAHNDAIQAHEDAVQAHMDFIQSQVMESTKKAMTSQASQNASSDSVNDEY
ncbi:MAG: hypothetical protein EGR10_03500 [Megasphaera elsdenii]|jgi:hypothetical protein|uniref:hypothetical protein n=1 Tax=Megasphaera elsdenii TaxID=907 RepID=UPI00204EC7D0|nr:hypothetical protein [Megasphaera elsdenii]MBD9021710.1 hypothetical protein [Megasphaera elsdenii]DAY68540.1 MAG TPA: hypothetical protein [Caudoviricetes sp.]